MQSQVHNNNQVQVLVVCNAQVFLLCYCPKGEGAVAMKKKQH
jgi:hypothetical protein